MLWEVDSKLLTCIPANINNPCFPISNFMLNCFSKKKRNQSIKRNTFRSSLEDRILRFTLGLNPGVQTLIYTTGGGHVREWTRQDRDVAHTRMSDSTTVFILAAVCVDNEKKRKNKKTICTSDKFVSRCNEEEFRTLFERLCKDAVKRRQRYPRATASAGKSRCLRSAPRRCDVTRHWQWR
jgi:hypothetical protein